MPADISAGMENLLREKENKCLPSNGFFYTVVLLRSFFVFSLSVACAAANLAMGTL